MSLELNWKCTCDDWALSTRASFREAIGPQQQAILREVSLLVTDAGNGSYRKPAGNRCIFRLNL